MEDYIAEMQEVREQRAKVLPAVVLMAHLIIKSAAAVVLVALG